MDVSCSNVIRIPVKCALWNGKKIFPAVMNLEDFICNTYFEIPTFCIQKKHILTYPNNRQILPIALRMLYALRPDKNYNTFPSSIVLFYMSISV